MSDDTFRPIMLERLQAVFPDTAIAAEALKSLDRIVKGEVGTYRSIVQLAVLKLCRSELWRLRVLVQTARKDFRDVLYPAQAPSQFVASTSRRSSPPKNEAITKREHAQWLQWINFQ